MKSDRDEIIKVNVVLNIQRMRICHVFAGTEGGSWVFDQLVAFKRGHGADVVAVLAGNEGTLPGKCREAGIPVHVIDFTARPGLPLLTLPFRMIRFACWLRRERIDVVQSHVINSTLLARPAAWFADVPVRLTMVTGPFYMQSPMTAKVERSTCRVETGIIPSCELTAKLYRAAGVPARLICETLYYGPSASHFDPSQSKPLGLRERLGLPEDTPLIASVALFYPRMPESGKHVPREVRGRLVKGHEDLIAAMPAILREFPKARMLFIGNGFGPGAAEQEEEIHRLIDEAGMTGIIIPTGYVTDVAGAYLDVDVSVQASLNENLGGIVESLLMARPTVATRVGGMVDGVLDGKTGVVVEPSNPQDLARGICELLRDPQRAAALGEAGRARMLEHFTLEVTVPALARIYARQRAMAPAKSWRLSRFAGRILVAPFRFAPEVFGSIVIRHMIIHWLVRRPLSLLARALGRARRLVRQEVCT